MSNPTDSVKPLIVDPDGTLFVFGEPITSHQVLKEVGRGANGVVYLTRNRLLKRDEALKVWLKLREFDRRDKIEQGIREATKLAQANGKHAVQIFNAQVLKNAVIATMEYVPGITLNEYRKQNHANNVLAIAALKYLDVIESTSTPDTFHGDPHLNNVLLFANKDEPHEPTWEMKLCDFGTSAFSGPDHSEERHWAVVRDTVRRLTQTLPSSEQAWEATKDLGAESRSLYEKMKESPNVFSARNRACARLAGLRDYLDYWR